MTHVLTGSDVLCARGFSDLDGLRIAFVGNHTSRLSDGTPTHQALHAAANVTLVKLFSPEHGAFGKEDHEAIGDDTDPVTGLPIQSLYGTHRKPTPEMLAGLDALVFEIQDIGARFYTYASTLLLCLEASDEAGVRLIVLDRPNPITGQHAEGPLPDPGKLSFTACHTIPVRHGLTMGELAKLAGAERGMGDLLTVVPCEGWTRDKWWDQTGLPWVNPSPAMRSLDAAAVYPGVCLLEQTNVSVGRGADAPFLIAGAPWIDALTWAAAIDKQCCTAVTARAIAFKPEASKYTGELCEGVRLIIKDRDALQSVRLGMVMITSLRDLFGDSFEMQGVNRLLASDETMALLASGTPAETIYASWATAHEEWFRRAGPYKIY